MCYIHILKQLNQIKESKVHLEPLIIDIKQVEDIEFEGIDTSDYPDFCDAFPSEAQYRGRNMTDEELDALMDQHSNWLDEQLREWINSYLY